MINAFTVNEGVNTGVPRWHLVLPSLLFDFDSALLQGSDFESKGDKSSSYTECRIRNYLEFWDTNSPADWKHTHKPTEPSRIKQKLELNSPSLWWVSIQPTWLHCRNWFTPGYGDIHTEYTRKWFRIERTQVVFLCWMQDSNFGSLRHQDVCNRFIITVKPV